MNDLFVSWHGDHAHRIGVLIRSLFDSYSDTFKVYLSTIDIGVADIWEHNLINNLRDASDGLIIFSQEAIKSDWLIHESAVLSSVISSQNKGPTIFLLGAPAEMLPKPLQRFQHASLSRSTLELWLDRIIEPRKLIISDQGRLAFLRKVEAEIKDYEATHVASAGRKWSGAMTRPIAISKQNDSPYELSELIRIARRRLILIAQNHGFMTAPEAGRDRIEEILFRKLAAGLTVDIVAMHPSVYPPKMPSGPDACAVWADYIRDPDFLLHLKRCWETLFSWNQKYLDERKRLNGKLRIKGAYFLPVTINIVDPDNMEGVMVLSPRLAQEASFPRPQFVITRSYEQIMFEFYWGTISNNFDSSGWIDIERPPITPREGKDLFAPFN